MIDTDIYKKNVDAHPYMTGMSFVLGMYAFNLQGMIYGPLILCFSLLAKEIFKQLVLNNGPSPKGKTKSSPQKNLFVKKQSQVIKPSIATNVKFRSRKGKLPSIPIIPTTDNII